MERTRQDVDAHLRAGAAIYNSGEFHAAHDAWEDRWLALDDGPDRDLLQGLIQFTASVYHADRRNWEGATGLAASASEYLAGLGPSRHGVALEPVRAYLASLEADPEVVERRAPIQLVMDGDAVTADELPFEAVAIAADVLAEEYGHDEELIERAIEYGRTDLDADAASSPFVTLLFDFVRGRKRAIVLQRLKEHVSRREHEESDVEGLF